MLFKNLSSEKVDSFIFSFIKEIEDWGLKLSMIEAFIINDF